MTQDSIYLFQKITEYKAFIICVCQIYMKIDLINSGILFVHILEMCGSALHLCSLQLLSLS